MPTYSYSRAAAIAKLPSRTPISRMRDRGATCLRSVLSRLQLVRSRAVRACAVSSALSCCEGFGRTSRRTGCESSATPTLLRYRHLHRLQARTTLPGICAQLHTSDEKQTGHRRGAREPLSRSFIRILIAEVSPLIAPKVGAV